MQVKRGGGYLHLKLHLKLLGELSVGALLRLLRLDITRTYGGRFSLGFAKTEGGSLGLVKG